MNRHDQVQDRRLTAEGVAMVVKRAAERAGLDPARYAGDHAADGAPVRGDGAPLHSRGVAVPSVQKVYRRYGTTIERPGGTYKGLRVVIEREEGKRPLGAEWGGIPLRRRKDAVLDDQPKRVWNVGTELLQRFLADKCELCGSHEDVQVHHERAPKDLQPQRNGSR